ncbi:MAG: formate dehydrogenase accessory sulfurtransferase FdhD [Pseudonocardiales bacterium]|nr:MAG: formate dehydrogenase accessory sulfurtransferase FdhD [Pseudonocardiales bacterium]
MGRVTDRRRIVRIDRDRRVERADTLAVEEPLEIRVGGRPLSVTMRTPGDDFDLVAGFLTTEGVIAGAGELATMRYCAGAPADGENTYNVVDATVAGTVAVPAYSVERNFYTTSSCGVCGKASIEAIRTVSRWPVGADPATVTAAVLSGLPDALRAGQAVFDKTGGLHAAGLFDSTGGLLCLREDVGRHNAVDKVVGWAARSGALPLTGRILMVSGRASFELAQKAVMAGIPVLAAVSAPSTLAVDLAREAGLTLVGFLRGATMNVYAGGQRVTG